MGRPDDVHFPTKIMVLNSLNRKFWAGHFDYGCKGEEKEKLPTELPRSLQT